jgi:hypothetical protein
MMSGLLGICQYYEAEEGERLGRMDGLYPAAKMGY